MKILKFRPPEIIFPTILEKSFRDRVIFQIFNNDYRVKCRSYKSKRPFRDSIVIDVVTRKYSGL